MVSGSFRFWQAHIAAENAAEAKRLADLKANEHLPLVYMDVSIANEAVGRMTFVLFPDESPRAAENYRQLFTGEKVLAHFFAPLHSVEPQHRSREESPAGVTAARTRLAVQAVRPCLDSQQCCRLAATSVGV